MSRRDALRLGGMAVWAASGSGAALAGSPAGSPVPAGAHRRPDYSLRIATGDIELAPGVVVRTTTYNGRFPGPLLRFAEGRPAVVDIHNATDRPELLHWHGQVVPAEVDGSAEEGTPFIRPHETRRVSFTAGPAGFRFYHTHVTARRDLTRGTFSGQAGPVYVDPKADPGAYDKEVFLTLKEFEPSLYRGDAMATDFLAGSRLPELERTNRKALTSPDGRAAPPGFEVGYRVFSVNGRMLGHGRPVRVRTGQRVLFHILNASATETRGLHLPGHTFRVVALDGNPVPRPAEVPVLWIGTAERVSALVEMDHPGVWVLGDVSDHARHRGLGTVVEYAGRGGPARWVAPPPFTWDYRTFALPGPPRESPDHTIDLLVEQRRTSRGPDLWTLNGVPFSMDTHKPVRHLDRGRRYRLRFRNASPDVHPLHLHRHTFEVTHAAGTPTHGLCKDVVMLGAYQTLDFDFTADQPGLSLLHCHQQFHMDYGFMLLLDCF
ncbi:copper oxidase [Actinomadura logoneensis]|uniref:Copper oxidase n=1 Tax=Actinomadura logoneensis TaxID=2293572 RepID=A0A372JJ71_9ACTN|nr:multicopper oxidase domain-containing protein [Actinomadura logoneensis]RFU40073.1 copper oxidase [Actinomadura logoneensis]